MAHRMVEVPPERLDRWVENFGARHGAVQVEGEAGGVTLRAADGSVAVVEAPWPPVDVRRLPVACVRRHAEMSRLVLVVAVRRGGFGAALVVDGDVVTSKHGTKYVQSRTAAGGWSQQRYARRRKNQTDGVVAGVLDAVDRMAAHLADGVGGFAAQDVVGVAPAGDAALVAAALADLPPVFADVPRCPTFAIADPRLDVTRDLAARVRCVRIRVDNAPGT